MLLPNALVLGVTQNIVRGIVKATRKSKEKRKKEVLEGTGASELIPSSPKKESGTLLSLPSKVESKVSPVVPTPSISSPEVTTAPASPTKAVSPISDTVPKAPSLDAPTLPKIKGSVGENLSELIPGIGSGIKKNVEAIVRSRLPDTPVSANGLFDGIDDKTIEKSIPLAEDTIKRNLESGALGEDAADRYPNLLSGLTMFYAASERGKREAARRAREVAYTNKAIVHPSLPTNHFDEYFVEETDTSTGAKEHTPKNPTHSSEPSVPDNNTIDSSKYIPPANSHIKEGKASNGLYRAIYDKTSNVYYGIVIPSGKEDEPPEDLQFRDKTAEKISKIKYMTEDYVSQSKHFHIKMWRDSAKLLSTGEMQIVLDDMLSHFLSGSGTDYSNNILTKHVREHKVTQQFMADFSSVFNDFVVKNNGDIGAFANSAEFRKGLTDNDVLISSYAYKGMDTFTGLRMAIHGWTESSVDVKSFEVFPDGTYNGTLTFTFSDNFGLDEDDINEFGFIPGFKSWYILQHSTAYTDNFKPFKTVVKLDYPISGKLRHYKIGKVLI